MSAASLARAATPVYEAFVAHVRDLAREHDVGPEEMLALAKTWRMRGDLTAPGLLGTSRVRAEDATTVVFTDGACRGNPGPAGWAWVRQDGTWARGHLPHATNQVVELMAILEALRDHDQVADLEIRSDSIYAINTYTSWMDAHAARGWRTAGGKGVSNLELIKSLRAVRDARRSAGLPPAKMVKVKGHSGVIGNEWADHHSVKASRGGPARVEAGADLSDLTRLPGREER